MQFKNLALLTLSLGIGASCNSASISPGDGGTPDSGEFDAGTLDGGIPDAGPSDAGNVDAGTNDGGIVAPYGIYVNGAGQNSTDPLVIIPDSLLNSPTYQNDIAGVFIRVPLINILPTDGVNFDWTSFDGVLQRAVLHGKTFTLGIMPNTTLPQWLIDDCETGTTPACAAPFQEWLTGGPSGSCVNLHILFPWHPKIQALWARVANAVAQHLREKGYYDQLRLVHLAGVTNYSLELRLPAGVPLPSNPSACPNVATDASQTRWLSLGYSDQGVIDGWTAIANAFATAFPDRYLDQAIIGAANDFPSFEGHSPGYIASQTMAAAKTIAPGRFVIQWNALNLATAPGGGINGSVKSLAALNHFEIGWQSNRSGSFGASCDGSPCDAASFELLLKNGVDNGGIYLEVWPGDVPAYPTAFDHAKALGWYAPSSH